jgi:glycolate oxidase FAD binding subunit
VPQRGTTLAALGHACPAGARAGCERDTVDGRVPDFVAYATNTQEVAAALKVAAHDGLVVVARGAGTKQDWGAPPERVCLVLDISKMSGILEHVSGDLVVTAKAGTTLRELSQALAGAGQRLPLDEVVPGSTLGGVVATATSGPLRYGHGSVRDLLLGVTMVRSDGVVARSGGKVVKNVAGYDLPKLLTGSYGTLGIVTELTFKLRPVPQSCLFVSAVYEDPADVAPTLATLLSCPAAPAAIEVNRASPRSPVELCSLVEGRPAPVEARARQLARLVPCATVGNLAPDWWGRLPGPLTVKMTSVLSNVPALIGQTGKACDDLGLPATLSGSAGAGVLYLGLPAATPKEDLKALLAELRRAASGAEGHATVLRAPAPLKLGLDVWGPVPGLELMKRVKQQFDPYRLLAPGRFVGGI